MTQVWTVQSGELVRRGASQDTFVMDTTRPDASNTGLAVAGLSYGDLTVHNGNITVTTSNMVIENLLLYGQVRINSGVDGTIIRNCVIVGNNTQLNTGGMVLNFGGTNTLVENCEISEYDFINDIDHSGWIISGAQCYSGGDMTVRRCNIHDCDDGVTAYQGGVIEAAGNYIHDLAFRTDDPEHASSTPAYWSHNDCVQIGAAAGHYIHGNNFVHFLSTVSGMGRDANPDALNCQGMMIQCSTDPIDVRIEYNWFSGAHIGGPNFNGKSSANPGNATMLGNRFTPNQLGYSGNGDWMCQILNNPNNSFVVTGAETSVYSDDSDTPAEWRGQPIQASSSISGGTATGWFFNPNLDP